MVFTRQQRYIQILNWDRSNNSITYREAKDRYVDNTLTPKTEKLSIVYNRVFVGSVSFNRKYLKTIKDANKIPEEQTSGDDQCSITRLQIRKNN